MTSDPIREAARAGRTLLNGWSTFNDPYVIELLAAAGYDLVTIDQQHGQGGPERLLGCLTAARAAGLPALVRVAHNDFGLIGRALDAGAQGVICPMIDGAADAARLVDAAKYAPLGTRSWGPYRAKLLLDGDHFTKANGWTIACAQIETRGALDDLDAILAVDGLDMVYLGPNDLSVALTGRLDIRAKEVTEAIDLVVRKARESAVVPAIFANDAAFALPLIAAGWTVVAVGTDAGLLSDAAARQIADLRT